MTSQSFEYGIGGLIGIAPPQSNPTVEPEMAVLMPPDVAVLTTRLRGDLTDARQRFADYLLNLDESLKGYGALKLGALGFACTATTYLVGTDAVTQEFSRLSERYGYPIISSADAIRDALLDLGASRIALFGPYPDWLQQEAFAYWEKSPFEIVARGGVGLGTSNTLGIYDLTAARIVEAVSAMSCAQADAIVLTGTGAPTLRAVPILERTFGKPVLTSNACLAWALLRQIGHAAARNWSATSGVPIDGLPERLTQR